MLFVVCCVLYLIALTNAEFESKSLPLTVSQVAKGSGYHRTQQQPAKVAFYHDATKKQMRMDTTTQGVYYMNDPDGTYRVTKTTAGGEACEFILGWTYAMFMAAHNDKKTQYLGNWKFKELDEMELDTYLNHDGKDASLFLFETTGPLKGALKGFFMAILSEKTTDFTYTLDWYDTVELKAPDESELKEPASCTGMKAAAQAKAKANSGTTPHKVLAQEIQFDAEVASEITGTRMDTPTKHDFSSEFDDDYQPVGFHARRKARKVAAQAVTGLPAQENLDLKHDLVVEKGSETQIEVVVPKKAGDPETTSTEKYDIEVNHDSTKGIYTVARKEEGTDKWQGTEIFEKEGMWAYMANPTDPNSPSCMFDSGMKYEAMMKAWTSLGQTGDFDFVGTVTPKGGADLKMWIGTSMKEEKSGAMIVLVGGNGLEAIIYSTYGQVGEKETMLEFNEKILTNAKAETPKATALEIPDTCQNYKKQCNVKDARKCIARILQFNIFEDTKCEVIDKARKCYVDTFCVQHKERVCSSETGKQCALKECA